MAILEVSGLTKHFEVNPGFLGRLLSGKHRQTIKAVDGVSFAMEAGEIMGIAGESGCGKSTTCLLISKLHEPTGGSIRFKGDVARPTDPPPATREIEPGHWAACQLLDNSVAERAG